MGTSKQTNNSTVSLSQFSDAFTPANPDWNTVTPGRSDANLYKAAYAQHRQPPKDNNYAHQDWSRGKFYKINLSGAKLHHIKLGYFEENPRIESLRLGIIEASRHTSADCFKFNHGINLEEINQHLHHYEIQIFTKTNEKNQSETDDVSRDTLRNMVAHSLVRECAKIVGNPVKTEENQEAEQKSTEEKAIRILLEAFDHSYFKNRYSISNNSLSLIRGLIPIQYGKPLTSAAVAISVYLLALMPKSTLEKKGSDILNYFTGDKERKNQLIDAIKKLKSANLLESEIKEAIASNSSALSCIMNTRRHIGSERDPNETASSKTLHRLFPGISRNSNSLFCCRQPQTIGPDQPANAAQLKS